MNSTIYLESVAKKHVLSLQTPGSLGSAVIIGRKGDQYLALTAGHALADINPSEEIFVSSLDSGKSYRVSKAISLRKGVDVSAVVFKSQDSLNISILDFAGAPLFECNDSIQERREFYGDLVDDWNACYHSTQTAGISAPTGAVTVPLLRLTKHTRMMPRVRGNRDGYEFMYEASTVPGMSGGGVFGYREYCETSSNRRTGNVSLVAIHGRSEDYVSGGRSGISLAVPVDILQKEIRAISSDYGVPITKEEIKVIVQNQYCG